jgi:hypothetical protein
LTAEDFFSGLLSNPAKASIFSIEAVTVVKASALTAEIVSTAIEIPVKILILRADFIFLS